MRERARDRRERSAAVKALALMRVFFIRDLLIDASYKVSIAIEIADVAIGAAGFFYLSRVIGDRHPAGYDAFGFILAGVAVNSGMTTALACFAQSVKADQQAGTLKPLLLSPLPSGALVALSSVYPLLRSAASTVSYLAAGVLLFGLTAARVNITASMVVLAVALCAFAAIGLMSAAFTLVFKRGDPLLWLFGALSWLLGGVFFPVSMLPRPLQTAAGLLPITYALDALRATLLAGAGLPAVAHEVEVLAAIAIVGIPVAAAALSAATTWSRRAGTLGHA
jgi:ABC-2 type transport system permease protein